MRRPRPPRRICYFGPNICSFMPSWRTAVDPWHVRAFVSALGTGQGRPRMRPDGVMVAPLHRPGRSPIKGGGVQGLGMLPTATARRPLNCAYSTILTAGWTRQSLRPPSPAKKDPVKRDVRSGLRLDK
jgi:hypothetical protein